MIDRQNEPKEKYHNIFKAKNYEMLEYYKSLKHSYKDVSWFITNCKFAKTPEMLKYLESLKN